MTADSDALQSAADALAQVSTTARQHFDEIPSKFQQIDQAVQQAQADVDGYINNALDQMRDLVYLPPNIISNPLFYDIETNQPSVSGWFANGLKIEAISAWYMGAETVYWSPSLVDERLANGTATLIAEEATPQKPLVAKATGNYDTNRPRTGHGGLISGWGAAGLPACILKITADANLSTSAAPRFLNFSAGAGQKYRFGSRMAFRCWIKVVQGTASIGYDHAGHQGSIRNGFTKADCDQFEHGWKPIRTDQRTSKTSCARGHYSLLGFSDDEPVEAYLYAPYAAYYAHDFHDDPRYIVSRGH